MAQYKTKETVLKHIALGELFNEKRFELFHNDRECILTYLKTGRKFVLNDDRFFNDKEVMTLTIKNGLHSLPDFVLKTELINDYNFVEEVIRYNPNLARYIPLDFLDDYGVAESFTRGCNAKDEYSLIQHFSLNIRSSKNLMLDLIEKNFNAMTFASDSLKNERDFVAAAIRINSKCIHFASDTLKADRNLAILAFNFADEQDKTLNIQNFPHALRQDRQVAEFAVAHNPTNIRYLSQELKNDLDMQHHAFLFAKDDGVINHLQILLNMEGVDPLPYLQKCILERNLSLSIPEKEEEKKNKVKI